MDQHKEKLEPGKIKLINFVSILLGFANAMGLYTMSSYFELAAGTSSVSWFYFVSYLAILVLYLNYPRIARRIGKIQVFFASLGLQLSLLIILAFLPVSLAGAILLAVYVLAVNACLIGIDVLLECFSEDRLSGRIRGLNLAIANIGFIFGPMVSMRLVDAFSFQLVFALQVVIVFFAAISVYFGLDGFRPAYSQRNSVWESIKRISSRRDIINASWIYFVLNFFYAIMVVYSPLYLHSLGFSLTEIGQMFTIMLVPFVFLPYLVGRLADKVWGEKEMLTVSILIILAASAPIFFLEDKSFWLWAGILFATRIGAAMLETLSDSYFYKRIDQDDLEMINFYRSARPLAYIFSSFLSMLVLSSLPLRWVFLVLLAVVATGLIPAWRLEDNRSEREAERPASPSSL